jgi:hypothetical protein
MQLWSIVIAICATISAVVIPARLVLAHQPIVAFDVFDWFVTVVFSLDIVLHLRMAALRSAPADHEPLGILRGYGTWILVGDLLAAIPFHAMFVGTPFELLRLLKLARTAEVFHRWRYGQVQNWSVLRLVFFVYWLILSVHWLACGWIALSGVAADQSQWSSYLVSLYWCVSTLTTVGYGDITPTTNGERLYAMGVMIVGIGMYSYVIGNVATILAGIQPARTRYLENMERLTAFMRYRNLPPKLQRRIRDYFAYLWSKRLGYDESTVLSELPPSLLTEVALFLKQDIIEKVPFFQGAGDELVKDIALVMRPVVYTPGDFVFRAGDQGREMYFISRGTLEVLAKDGSTVYTRLKDGDFFGEIALLLNLPRTASIRAIDYCDLYALDKDAFERILARYPAFADHVREMTKERQERGM